MTRRPAEARPQPELEARADLSAALLAGEVPRDSTQ
jgi:hypothetical protein